MSEHTKGPWHVGMCHESMAEIHNGKKVLAVCSTREHVPSHEMHLEMMANARLIAVAPELLAAAKNLLTHAHKEFAGTDGWTDLEVDSSDLENLRTAIDAAMSNPGERQG